MQTCAVVVVVVVVVYEKDTLIIIKLSCKKIVSKWMWEEDFLFVFDYYESQESTPTHMFISDVLWCPTQQDREARTSHVAEENMETSEWRGW